MNKAISLLVLIHSMTKAEKRYFKLYKLPQMKKMILAAAALMMAAGASAVERMVFIVFSFGFL